MTFEEFKGLCKLKKSVDIKLPQEDKDYKPLLQESLEYVAKACTCLHLLQDDNSSLDKFRLLTNNQSLRKPIAKIGNGSLIDMDEQLCLAVVYDLLSNKTLNALEKSFYVQKRDQEINNYNWNLYGYLCEIGLV